MDKKQKKEAQEAKKIESKANSHYSVLVYGKAGAGKSIFASTFPKPLIFDFDYGHQRYEEKKAFPEATYIRGKNTLPYFIEALKKVEEGSLNYETIVIDSVTALENAAINNFKGFNTDTFSDMLYTDKGKEMSYNKWGAISASTLALLTFLRPFPIHLVLVTQVDTYKVDSTEKFRPELVGKGVNESLHFADFVMFMENGTDSRKGYLNSNASSNFVAKARLANKNVSYIKNPNFAKLKELVENTEIDLDFT